MLFLLHVILTSREAIVSTGSQALRYLGGMDEFRNDRLSLLGGASAHPPDEEGHQPLDQQLRNNAPRFRCGDPLADCRAILCICWPSVVGRTLWKQ